MYLCVVGEEVWEYTPCLLVSPEWLEQSALLVLTQAQSCDWASDEQVRWAVLRALEPPQATNSLADSHKVQCP